MPLTTRQALLDRIKSSGGLYRVLEPQLSSYTTPEAVTIFLSKILQGTVLTENLCLSLLWPWMVEDKDMAPNQTIQYEGIMAYFRGLTPTKHGKNALEQFHMSVHVLIGVWKTFEPLTGDECKP